MIATLSQSIHRHRSRLIQVRRHLHRNPELSGQEVQTTRFLADQLKQEQIDFRLGPEDRGLVVDLGNPEAKQRLALRADIDAIAVQDTKCVDYRSEVDSVMHACGHDAHAAMLLTTVLSLNDAFQISPPQHAVRAIFQPEEEVATGAQRMIDFGALDDVTAILGAHVDPKRKVGRIGMRSGVITAHCTEIYIDVMGQGGHAARPSETIDPIEVAMSFIADCYSALPRYAPPPNPLVLSFTGIHAGERTNVIPEQLRLMGTIRSLDTDQRELAIAKIHEIATAHERSSGAKIRVKMGVIVPSVIADDGTTDVVRRICQQTLSPEQIEVVPQPSMGGEDFAFYSQRVPAAFIRLGSQGEETGGLPLHNPGFDIDEQVLSVGVNVLTQIATRFFEG